MGNIGVQEDPRVRDLIGDCLIELVPKPMRPAAAKLPLDTLLHRVSTWQYRRILPRPRTVQVAPELAQDSGADPVVVAEMIRRLEAGDDMSAFLSKDARNPHLKPAGDHAPDNALAVWGVHHLHTSLNVEANGLVTRTKTLLWVYVDTDEVAVFGLLDHGHWAQDEIVRRCERHWPDRVFHELKGVVGLSQHFDENQRAELHSAGVTTLFEVDGKFYMGSSQTVTGTPAVVVDEANAVLHQLRKWDMILADPTSSYEGWHAELRGTQFGLTDSTRFEPVVQVKVGRGWITSR